MQHKGHIQLRAGKARALLGVTAVLLGMFLAGFYGVTSPRLAFATNVPPTAKESLTQEKTATEVCIIARVTGVPAQTQAVTSDIVFQSATSKIAQTNVQALCDAVLANQELSVTLAITPVFLAQWPQEEIALLQEAIATGRLELVALGYADPDFSILDEVCCLEDITAQYRLAREQELGVAYSTGTVPLGAALPQGAATLLAESNITWTAVDASCIDAGSAENAGSAGNVGDTGSAGAAPAGVFTSSEVPGLSILSVDTTHAADLLAPDYTLARTALETSTADNPTLPHAFLVEIGSVQGAGNRLVSTLTSIAQNDRFSLATGSKVVAQAKTSPLARLKASKALDSTGIDNSSEATALADYLDSLRLARDDVRAFDRVLYSSSTTFVRATGYFHLGQFGNWKAAGSEGLREGTAYLRETSYLIENLLDDIWIFVEPIVLAGPKGTIPVVIINESDIAFEIELTFEPGSGASIASDELAQGTKVVLYTGENYVEVPVALEQKESTMGFVAQTDGYIITKENITVTTSPIDQITIILCILAALVAVIVYIRKHTRARQTKKEVEL